MNPNLSLDPRKPTPSYVATALLLLMAGISIGLFYHMIVVSQTVFFIAILNMGAVLLLLGGPVECLYREREKLLREAIMNEPHKQETSEDTDKHYWVEAYLVEYSSSGVSKEESPPFICADKELIFKGLI